MKRRQDEDSGHRTVRPLTLKAALFVSLVAVGVSKMVFEVPINDEVVGRRSDVLPADREQKRDRRE